ncbi:MAG: type II toxin-antitoxin system RelE/ParE family toxin [Candidatus Levybacteria bacterium]|nr:type II toxin-antitoxin system RelE/ParE family toxin [Candidatus Levybacteria bacterium]
MDEQWKIQLYRTPKGNSPVKEFIDSLELKAQAKVYDAVNLLRDFGTRLGLPHVKKLADTELWELRILGTDNIQILYIAVTGKAFLLLHGFKKKKDKTPPKEIRIAEERLAEHISRE